MHDKENVKEKRLSQALLNPTVERLKKWIEQIEKTALESNSDMIINDCNRKIDKANEGLNAIAGFYADIYDYSVVQKALADCKKIGFC